MSKNLHALFASAFLTVGLCVQATTMDFTYAQGELFAYGQGQKESIDVAMLINNGSLVGSKIKKINAYVTCVEGLENTSIWLTKDLTLENKVNIPDIASYEVVPVAYQIGEETLGLMTIELEEPYILTNEPIYVGYSMTVADNRDLTQKYPIVLSEGANDNGLFLHMSKSVLKWMNYSEKAGGVAYIIVTLEGDFKDYSLAITGTGEAYVLENENYDLEIQVSNNGSKTINSLKYKYSYDDSDVIYEGSSVLPSPIESDMTLKWPVTLSFQGVTGLGPHVLNLMITEVDDNENESLYAAAECRVNVMPYKPVHRPLVEEFTGLWCGWCPRGFVAMEKLSEIYKDQFVPICYHNGNDPMAVTSVYPVEFNGFPNSALNREIILDPYYGTYDTSIDFGISYDVQNSMNDFTMADIEVEAVLNQNKVEINSSTTFMVDIDNSKYQVGYVLVANDLRGLYWAQVNYYAGLESEYVGTYLEDICKMPAAILGLQFNDVAIDVAGMKGVENSLPSTIKTGELYTSEFSYDIEGNVLVQDPNNLVVCAMVINTETGAVINANQTKVKVDSNGIEGISDNLEILNTEYFDLTGRKISSPMNGLVVKRDKLSDGSFRTSKVMIK